MELMYQILNKENIKEAVKRVKANKGASGIDKIKVSELDQYMQENFAKIKHFELLIFTGSHNGFPPP